MTELKTLIVDTPAEFVSRITLNRPEKRNALSNELRAELFRVLEQNDDDENIRVTIIRGAHAQPAGLAVSPLADECTRCDGNDVDRRFIDWCRGGSQWYGK